MTTGASDRDATLAVVIPTLNEVESIGPVVAEIRRQVLGRVLVADGGSRDGTAAAATAAGAEVLDVGRGYGRACLRGAEAAPEAVVVVFMDGDGADDPAFIPEMVAPLLAGTADFVIGSRVRGVREPGSMGWHQIAAGLGAGFGMRLLYGTRYSDMCAFRAIRRDTLLSLGMQEMTYGWNLEMQMRVARAGLRVREIPVPCRRRIGGTSNVSGTLKGTLRASRQIISTFLRVASGPASRIEARS